jgi:hypothetical protein
MRERWKDVAGFPNYQISNLGRVLSKERVELYDVKGSTRKRVRRAKILRWSFNTHGYPSVELWDGGTKGSRLLIHRLVALAFIGPPPVGRDWVLHRDDNPLNCYVKNLRWGTPLDNTNDRNLNGNTVRGERQHCSRLTEKDVLKIRKKLMALPNETIGNMFGVHKDTIRDLKSGHTWKHVHVG